MVLEYEVKKETAREKVWERKSQREKQILTAGTHTLKSRTLANVERRKNDW